MGCFFALQRAVAPCLNGYLFPTALFASRLNCRSRGGGEICLVSKRMFIPDGTPVLVTEYYILTRRKPEVLNMVVCSATSVESCLYRRVLKGSVRVRPRLWVGKTIDIALFLTVTEAENWYFSRMCGQKLTRWFSVRLSTSASSAVSTWSTTWAGRMVRFVNISVLPL